MRDERRELKVLTRASVLMYLSLVIVAVLVMGCSAESQQVAAEEPENVVTQSQPADTVPRLTPVELSREYWNAWVTAESFGDLLPFVTGKFEEQLRKEMASSGSENTFRKAKRIHVEREIERIVSGKGTESVQVGITLTPLYDSDSGATITTKVSHLLANNNGEWSIKSESYRSARRIFGKAEKTASHTLSWGEWTPQWRASNRLQVGENHFGRDGQPIVMYMEPLLEGSSILSSDTERELTTGLIVYYYKTNALGVTLSGRGGAMFTMHDFYGEPGIFLQGAGRDLYLVYEFDDEFIELERRTLPRAVDVDVSALSFDEASQMGTFRLYFQSEYVYVAERNPPITLKSITR